VAAVAAGAEVALVDIIGAVADTAKSGGLGREERLEVTVLTLHLGMGSPESVARFLEVVEVLSLPGGVNVTPLALGAEPAVVLVVFLVAGVTHTARIREQLRRVALGTRHGLVFTGQRKFRFLVVETRSLFPGLDVVASLAAVAQLVLVHVVLLVTPGAGGRRLIQLRRGVAGEAFDLAVGVHQGEIGLVVIERRLFPVPLDVAAFALRAEDSLVGVVRLVALDALHRRAFVALALVALLARHVNVLAEEGVLGLGVVETELLPVGRRVAIGALCA